MGGAHTIFLVSSSIVPFKTGFKEVVFEFWDKLLHKNQSGNVYTGKEYTEGYEVIVFVRKSNRGLTMTSKEEMASKERMIKDLMREENLKKFYKYLYFTDFYSCNVKGNDIVGYNGGISDEIVKKLLDEVNNTNTGNPKIKRSKLFDLVTTRRCLMIYDGTSVQIPKFNYRRYPDSSTIFITSFIPSPEFRSDSKGVVTLSIDVVPRFDINMLNVTFKKSIMSVLFDSFNYVIYSPDKRFSYELSQRGITLVTPTDIGLEVEFSDYSDIRHFARRY